ncbi:unnamed protein product [Lupinus luteus]|uniref:Uncharacterized protein n=1 Tax=Lupinus luteus TaxID=3873 RepID=A0AAV1Y203_LUPLU
MANDDASHTLAAIKNDGSVLLLCGSQHQKTKLLLSAMPTLLLVLLLLLSPFASPLTEEELAAQLGEGANDLTKTVEAIKDAKQRGALLFSAREGHTEICK